MPRSFGPDQERSRFPQDMPASRPVSETRSLKPGVYLIVVPVRASSTDEAFDIVS